MYKLACLTAAELDDLAIFEPILCKINAQDGSFVVGTNVFNGNCNICRVDTKTRLFTLDRSGISHLICDRCKTRFDEHLHLIQSVFGKGQYDSCYAVILRKVIMLLTACYNVTKQSTVVDYYGKKCHLCTTSNYRCRSTMIIRARKYHLCATHGAYHMRNVAIYIHVQRAYMMRAAPLYVLIGAIGGLCGDVVAHIRELIIPLTAVDIRMKAISGDEVWAL